MTNKKPSSTVSLRNVVYCIMTDEDAETYEDEIRPLIGAIDAKISTETSTDTQYADDGPYSTMDSEGDTKIEFKVVDVPLYVRADLLGKKFDSNGVLLDSSEDRAPYVAIGFKSQKNNASWRYIWLYKGKFTMGDESFHTREEKGTFQEPVLNGAFVNRIKDGLKKATADSDSQNIMQEVLEHWFDSVYESIAAAGV